MRALLEYLGIVAPPSGRRDPVVLPGWSRLLLPLLVPALAIASTLVFAIARALVG